MDLKIFSNTSCFSFLLCVCLSCLLSLFLFLLGRVIFTSHFFFSHACLLVDLPSLCLFHLLALCVSVFLPTCSSLRLVLLPLWFFPAERLSSKGNDRVTMECFGYGGMKKKLITSVLNTQFLVTEASRHVCR